MRRFGFRFEGLDRDVAVASDLDLAPHLPRFLARWPAATTSPPDRPDIEVEALPASLAERYTEAGDNWGGGFRLRHASIAGGFMDCPTPEETANQLTGLLIAAAAPRERRLVSVHAGAFGSRAGIVLLAGASQAGKSSLALQTMLRGARLWADDRVLVDPAAACAIALGLTARMRLPVPRPVGPALAALVDREGRAEGETAWLALTDGRAARFGETAAIAAVVLPRRVEAGPSSLERVSAGLATRALLDGAAGLGVGVGDLLPTLAACVACLPCWRLNWSSSDDAAARLAQEFPPA